MCEYKVSEDRTRLLMCSILNLIIVLILLILAAGFYSYGAFLFAFLFITGIWFSVKAMCKYASKWVKKTPVCEFKKDEVIIYTLPGDPIVMKYRDISEVKILRTSHSLKLFFSSELVKHPSGWYYAAARYPFQRSGLQDIEQKSEKLLMKHNVLVRKAGVNE